MTNTEIHQPTCTCVCDSAPDQLGHTCTECPEHNAQAWFNAEYRRELRTQAIYDNPNRPTPQGYCANGAHSTDFHYDDDGSCYLTPRPLTAYDQGIRDRGTTVNALTDEQMRTALIYLSGATDSWDTGKASARWTNAIAYALNPR